MGRFSSKRSVACFIAVLLSGFVLTACGDDQGSTSGAGTAEKKAAGVAKEPTDPPAPGFTDNSGVTDLPAFGIEASPAERGEAQESLSTYLDALRAQAWDKACAYLDSAAIAQLRQLTAKVPSITDKSCGEALRLVSTSPSAQPSPYNGPIELSALRIKRGGGAREGAGFALFHGDDGDDYWITMRLDDGSWKVTALSLQRLK